jgi:mannose-6-phosphate isomerase-like protein (cupin superfamily)
MDLRYPLIDVDSAEPVDVGNGVTAGNDLRLFTDIPEIKSALAYYLTIPPGGSRGRQINRNADEALILLEGGGVAGVGSETATMNAGHCQFIPKGREHFFVNTGDSDAVLVGYYLGVTEAEAIGLENTTPATLADAAGAGTTIAEGIFVHLEDVAQENMNKGEGWNITDFRLPLSAKNGCTSALFRARFFPGAVHAKHEHENCEEIYFVISGHGLAGAGPDRVEVHGGQFHYIPSGVEHWLHNLSATDPIEVVGIYVGAGSVAETGYVFKGNVTDEDLQTA